jgi:hypothetical protein
MEFAVFKDFMAASELNFQLTQTARIFPKDLTNCP